MAEKTVMYELGKVISEIEKTTPDDSMPLTSQECISYAILNVLIEIREELKKIRLFQGD